MIDKIKLRQVTESLSAEELMQMFSHASLCPSRFKLSDSICNFTSCETCWRRALKATQVTLPENVIK